MKKWLAGLGLGVLALGGALAVRTVTFAPAGVSDGSDIKVAAAPAFDLAGTNFSSLCCDVLCPSVLALRIRL